MKVRIKTDWSPKADHISEGKNAIAKMDKAIAQHEQANVAWQMQIEQRKQSNYVAFSPKERKFKKMRILNFYNWRSADPLLPHGWMTKANVDDPEFGEDRDNEIVQKSAKEKLYLQPTQPDIDKKEDDGLYDMPAHMKAVFGQVEKEIREGKLVVASVPELYRVVAARVAAYQEAKPASLDRFTAKAD